MSLKLKFNPSKDGDASGTITVSSDSASSPTLAVKVHGKGVVASTPSLSASASTLSFGQVLVGSEATKTMTVTSTGTAPATITAGSVTGASYTATYAGVPVGSLSAPITLQPGQQVTFSVTFDPSHDGYNDRTIEPRDGYGCARQCGTDRPGKAGTAPALTLSAPSLNFGDVQMGAKCGAATDADLIWHSACDDFVGDDCRAAI